MKQKMKLRVPKQMQLLCHFVGISPQRVLQAFLDDVAIDIKNLDETDRRKIVTTYLIDRAEDYFKSCEFADSQLNDEMERLVTEWPTERTFSRDILQRIRKGKRQVYQP